MNAKLRKRIYYSLLFSIFIHFGFFVWSFFVKILPVYHSEDKPERFMQVKIATEEDIGQEETPSTEALAPEKLLTPDDPFEKSTVLEPRLQTQEVVRDTIAAAVPKENQPPILSQEEETQDLRSAQHNEVSISRKAKRVTRQELIDIGDIPSADSEFGSPVVVSGENISRDFLDKSNVARKTAPAAAAASSGSALNEFKIMKRNSAGIRKKSKTSDLGTSLMFELFKYQPPQSDLKYFKLVVKVRDATISFPVIPKEIVFLLDASRSIGPQRFAQFVQGLTHGLKNLNPSDRFNVLIFKDQIIPLSDKALSPEEVNIKKAVEFLKNLKVGSTTDVYKALKESIDMQDAFTPSYRVLLSDGFPTRGVVDARQLINEISAINDGKVSIFAFGGGVDVSPYMLDFIAYKNRGWSQVVDREWFIGRELSKLYDRIKDPLLLHLRYHISGLNDREIYPQILPDFFKGSELVIYGTFTDEDKFYMQVLGDVQNDKKEFVVTASLNEAQQGNKDIARQWAFHKIYHLIGQLKHKESNTALITQIEELCAKYNIITPYSKNFSKERAKSAAPVSPKTDDTAPAAPGSNNFAGTPADTR